LATPPNSLGWSALALIAVLVGCGWRAAHLENRPLHADEAVQAWQTWTLLKGDGYTYDPVDRHGPLLYYGSAAQHRLTRGTAQTYDDRAARRFVFAAGVATLILVAFGARTVGFAAPIGALAATLLIFETFTSLYHTYFVQEAWLALFVWAFLFVGLRQNPARPLTRLFVMGCLAGLAQATKETAPLYLGVALACIYSVNRRRPTWPTPAAFAATLLGFAIPVVTLYTAFGTQLSGLLDAVRTYTLQADRIAVTPHAYPWWHYARTLGLVPTGGPRWGQFMLLGLALVGTASAFRRTATRSHRVLALFVWSLLIIHSAISYKTPWLILTPVIGLPLLAAYPLLTLGRKGRWGLFAAALLVGATVMESGWRSWLALDRYPGDSRNPYFYEQAPRSFFRLTDRLAQLQTALDRPLRIAVISGEAAWPLPWYLRESTATGYFESLPPEPSHWDVVIWDRQLGEPPEGLSSNHLVEYHGLRPNVLLEVFIDQTVWERLFPPLLNAPLP
jgi:predicted membrane-bound mannosyltransferase